MYESALSMNTSQAPTAATSTPAIAGPMARDTLMAMLFSAMAAGMSSGGTRSGTIAAHAGSIIAEPTPRAKTKPISNHAVVMSSNVRMPSAPATINKYVWMAIKRRRRSTMSASAPAGSASSINGKLSAASTSATIDGDDESDVISQPAPTSCIHVPIFETMVAIQRLRNSAFLSGLHAERSAVIVVSGETSVLA